MTTTHTIIIQALLILVQIGNQVSDIVPVKWKPVVLGLVGLLQIGQAALAHQYNPDGSSAKIAYVPDQH